MVGKSTLVVHPSVPACSHIAMIARVILHRSHYYQFKAEGLATFSTKLEILHLGNNVSKPHIMRLRQHFFSTPHFLCWACLCFSHSAVRSVAVIGTSIPDVVGHPFSFSKFHVPHWNQIEFTGFICTILGLGTILFQHAH